jgi:hypothetical protein
MDQMSSFILLEMNQTSLNDLLKYRKHAMRPVLPKSFSSDVWRRIRAQNDDRQEASIGIVFWQWLLRPQPVVAALTLAITAGVAIGASSSLSQVARTYEALDLELFGERASELPSTLLTAKL